MNAPALHGERSSRRCYVFGTHETAGLDIAFGLTERIVQGCAISLVEPITRIQRKELDLRALREVRGLVDDQSPGPDARL